MIDNSTQDNSAADAILNGDDYAAFEAFRNTGKLPGQAETTDNEKESSDEGKGEEPEATSKTKTPPESDPEKPKADDEEEDDEDGKPLKKGLSKRFHKLTSELRDLKAQLAAATAAKQPTGDQGVASPTSEKTDDAEPSPDDFKTYGDYVKALASHQARQIVKAERQAASKADAETKAKADAEAQRKTWESRKAEAMKTPEYADLEELLEETEVPITPAMNTAIMRSEVGPQMAHYLAKNDAEAERISKLDPVDQVFELGLIAASIKSSSSKAKPATTKQVSKAPKPPTPVSGTGAPKFEVADEKTASDFSAWERAREAQLKNRRRR